MLHAFMQGIIKVGRLRVRHPNGRIETYGDGTGQLVGLRISSAAVRRLVSNPSLGLGESYMDGEIGIDEGDIWSLLDLVGRNRRHRPKRKEAGPLGRVVRDLRRRVQQWNDRERAKANVAHHYDLSYDLYRRFLDADMQYSCAYFARPDMTLEAAQAAKRAHLAAKLKLEPGMKVLDVGCGWGGLGLELAGRHGVQVQGITLSEEQLAVAQRRAQEAGLADRAKFSLMDFRDVKGPFDRIVSVGMFEHVGAPNFEAYFEAVRDLLTPDGVAVIHSIGRMSPPGLTDRWIAKYIFPGGYIPALSETLGAVEKSGLWVTDIEVLRLHYAETLKAWGERFMAERAAIAEIYDERFCRMWEFYLAGAEIAFRYGDHMNFQMQLAKRVDALPMTRDYMVDNERADIASQRDKARSAA